MARKNHRSTTLEAIMLARRERQNDLRETRAVLRAAARAERVLDAAARDFERAAAERESFAHVVSTCPSLSSRPFAGLASALRNA